MNQDTLYVIQTVAGGPSERVGILAGDRIVAVNDSTIAGVKMKNSDIMKRLKGPKGTDVDVKVLRPEGLAYDTIDFTITRADIPIYSVDASYMVDDKTGYIRVNKFAAETWKDVAKALSALKKEGMEQLILDLVDNGGGYLNAAVDILGELLPPESLAVYTEGVNSSRADSHANPSSPAIQDWDRGVIVGRRTFGKGLVQRPIPFPDGSMMRLTVAHYYTPTGRDIQKPYTKGNQKDYNLDILDRYNRGELMHEDSIHYNDSLKVNTLRLGRGIYGGGGISPDRFVALDTTAYTKYYRNVMAKGLINRFVIKYVDANRKKIKDRFKTDREFISGFEVTPEMLDELRKLSDKEGVEYDAEEAEKSRPLFCMVLKGLIGRDIYDNSTYYKVYNTYDPIFRKALEVINSDEYDKILSPADPPSERLPLPVR